MKKKKFEQIVFKNMPMINLRDEKIERYFIQHFRNYDLGFAIIDRLAADNVTLQNREIFYHTSNDVINVAMQDLINGKFDVKKYAKIEPLDARIVVFHEKHGESYYIYTSREEFYKIFLKVLTERDEEDWYSDEYDKPVKDVDMTLDQINAIKDEKLKNFQMQRFKTYEREFKEYQEMLQMQKNIKKAIAEKNGRLALYVMEERRDGEYENFEIIEPQRVE